MCSRIFWTKGELQRHARTHSGEKQHVCSICGKAFTSWQGWKYCEEKCSGKPFKFECSTCGKKFQVSVGSILHKNQFIFTILWLKESIFDSHESESTRPHSRLSSVSSVTSGRTRASGPSSASSRAARAPTSARPTCSSTSRTSTRGSCATCSPRGWRWRRSMRQNDQQDLFRKYRCY